MKIKIFLIFLLSIFLFSKISYSQNEFKIDSLKNIVENSQIDTSKFQAIIQLSVLQSDNDSLLSYQTADKALKFAKNKLPEKYEAFALQNISNIQRRFRNYHTALNYQKQAHAILVSTTDSTKLALCYYQIARIYYNLEKIDESIKYHKKALKIRQQKADTAAIAESLNAIGLMNWRAGEFESAEEYFLKSITVRKTINDYNGISIGYNNLGSIHWGLGNYNKALEYFLIALPNAKKNKNKSRIVLITNNIGLIYQEWDNYETALKYHYEAAKIGEEINYTFGLAYSYINIGTCYKHNKQYNKAINFIEKALENYTIGKSTIGVALSLRHIGEIYYDLDEYNRSINFLKKSLLEAEKVNSFHHISIAYKALAKSNFALRKYEIAKKEANKAYKIAIEKNYKEIIKESAFIISEIFKINKDFKNSLTYYKIAASYKDSIFNETKTKQIAEMQTKYETEKQNQQIELQETELAKKNAEIKEKQNMEKVLYIGLFSAITIALLIIIGYIKTQKANLEINKQKKELEKANNKLVELSKFKETLTGMIVHDLKNPLNMISNIAKTPQIKESVTRMYTLVMNMLDIQKFESSKMNIFIEEINLRDLINAAFIQVQFLITRKNIQFNNLISSNLAVKVDKEKIERVLINLLHNATKYTPNNGNITIKTIPMGLNKIKLIITNTGEGIPKEQLELIFTKFGQYKGTADSTGLGLSFCKMAMNAIKQDIGVESKLNESTTFWVSLEITENLESDSSIRITENKKNLFNFNTAEKEIVRKFSHEFKKNEIFEVSKLMQVIKKAKETEQPQIINWAKEIENSVLALNDKSFKELIQVSTS